MVLYPILEGEIAKQGIKKKDIAQNIGVCDKALSNKLGGRSPFTIPEGRAIQTGFFPDIPLETLFATSDELAAQKTESA